MWIRKAQKPSQTGTTGWRRNGSSDNFAKMGKGHHGAFDFTHEVECCAVVLPGQEGKLSVEFDGDSLSSYLYFMTVADLKNLSVAERLQLVEDLWDTIAEETSYITLSPEQKAELDHRLDAMEENPNQGTCWEVVKDRILATL